MQALILIGFMGAGKSSVGRALAARLGWAFEDLDERIERRKRKIVAEIFRESGEEFFRTAEHEALKELLEELSAESGRVIALGGGAYVQKANAGLIKAAKVPTAFLDADVEELWDRCQGQAQEQSAERPLLRSREDFRNLYRKRRRYYLKAAWRQETGGKSVEAVVDELIKALDLGRGGKRGEKR
jgi:shikimate kinase